MRVYKSAAQDAAVAACAHDKGMRLRDIAEAIGKPPKATQNVVTALIARGKLFASPCKAHRRYFVTAEAAAAWVRVVPKPEPRPQRQRVELKSSQPKPPAGARGPAHLPGEPVITKQTRIVVGPSPRQALRTNTHWQF